MRFNVRVFINILSVEIQRLSEQLPVPPQQILTDCIIICKYFCCFKSDFKYVYSCISFVHVFLFETKKELIDKFE